MMDGITQPHQESRPIALFQGNLVGREVAQELLTWLLLLAALGLVAFQALQQAADPFNSIHARAAEDFSATGHIGIFESIYGGFIHIPSLPALYMMLHQLLGADWQGLVYLPLLGPVLILSVFVLARRLGGSRPLSAFAAFVVVWGIDSPNYLLIWPHGVGLILFLNIFLLLVMGHSGALRRMESSLAVFLLVIGLHFMSYKVEIWAIGVLIALFVLRALFRRNAPSTFYLTAVALIIFLGFNQLIYGSFFNRVLELSGDFGILLFLQRYLAPAGASPFDFHMGSSYSLIALLHVAFLSLAVGTFVVFFLRDLVRGKAPAEAEMMYCVVFATVPYMVTYALFGFVEGSMIMLLFPLALVLLEKRIHERDVSRWLHAVWVLALAGLAIVVVAKVVVAWETGLIAHDGGRYENLAPAAAFISARVPSTTHVVGDLESGYTITQRLPRDSQSLKFDPIDRTTYGMLVSGTRQPPGRSQIYVVDYGLQPFVMGYYWGLYKPPSVFESQIEAHQQLRFFDGGPVVMYK